MSPRQIEVLGDKAKVPLSKGLFSIIDARDVPLVAGKNWCAQKGRHTNYAVRTEIVEGVRIRIYMHRIIASAHGEDFVDHKDGDGLNNTRENLRAATRSENARNCNISAANTSGFKGVSLHKKTGKWRAMINHNNRAIHIGLFEDPQSAHAAYCREAERLHGEFAKAQSQSTQSPQVHPCLDTTSPP